MKIAKMLKYKKSNILFLIISTIFLIGCGSPGGSSSDSFPTQSSLAFLNDSSLESTKFITALESDLNSSAVDFSSADVNTMKAGATDTIIEEKLTTSTDVSKVSSAVLRGAVLSVANITQSRKDDAIQVLATSVTNSLSGKVTESSLSPAYQPHFAPGLVAAIFPQDSFADILQSLAQITVRYLTQIGISSSDIAGTVQSTVEAMTGRLNAIGVTSNEIPTVAQAIISGAVGVLDDAGVSSTDMGSVIGNVINGGLTGLQTSGLSSADIAAAADEVAKGAVEGIQNVGATASDAETLMIGVKTSVNDSLDSITGDTSIKTPIQDSLDDVIIAGRSTVSGNSRPVAASQSSLTLDENSSLSITLSATDEEGSSLNFIIDSTPDHGTLKLPGGAALSVDSTMDGTSSPVVIYTPDVNYSDPSGDQFTFRAYEVNNTSYNSLPATITLSITDLANSYVSAQSGSILDNSTFGNGAGTRDVSDNAIIESGHIVTWDGSGGPYTGDIEIRSGGTLQITAGGGTISGDIVLNGGTLDVDADITISGSVTHSAASEIAILTGQTVTVDTTMDVNALTLTLSGAGTLTNTTGSIILDNVADTLKITGALSLGSAVMLAGGTLDIDGSATLTGDITYGGDSSVDILSGETFTYSGAALNTGGSKITLSGAGTFNSVGDITLDQVGSIIHVTGSGAILQSNVVLAGGILDIDENSSITGTLTHTASSNIKIAGGKTLTYTGTALSPGTTILVIPEAGTFAGDINLSGGTLQSSASSTISGTVTHSGDATLDIASGTTLTYTGTAVSINSNSLRIPNTGTFAGKLDLNGGTLDIDSSMEISDTLTLSVDSTLDIAASVTLTYSGTSLPVSTGRRLTLPATGTFAGSITLAGGAIDIDDDMTMSGSLTQSTSSSIDIAAGKIFTYSGPTFSTGGSIVSLINSGTLSNTTNAISIDSGSLKIDSSGTTVTGAITLAGGILDIDATADLSGNITITSSSGEINIAAGTTLNYTGSQIDIGSYTLDFNGAGIFNNTNAISLNDSSSILQLNGLSGTINNVSVDADAVSGKIDVQNSFGITTLTINKNTAIDGGNSNILTLAGSLSTPVAATVTLGARLKIPGGTLLGALAFNGGTLDISGNTAVSGGLSATDGTTSTLMIPTGVTFTGTSLNLASASTSTNLIIAGTGTALYEGDFVLSSGGVANFTGGDLSGDIDLSGGLLDVDDDLDMSGDITLATNATIDIANTKTLFYSGNPIILGGYSLSVIGGGELRATMQIDAGSTYQISGGTITNGIVLNGGTLSVLGDATFDADLTLSAASTINVSSGANFIYNGAGINLGTLALTFSGGGTFTNTGTNPISLNDPASVLNLFGSGATIGLVDVSADLTTGKIYTTQNSTIDTLNLYNNTTLESTGNATLSVGSTLFTTPAIDLQLLGNFSLPAATNSANTTLLGKKLSIRGNVTHSGVLVLSSSSTIDVASTATFSYTNAASINVGASFLTFSGTGIFDTGAQALALNNGTGGIKITGDGEIQGTITLTGGTLDVDSTSDISANIVHATSSTIDISSDATLTYTGAAIDVGSGQTLTLANSGTLLNTSAIQLDSNDSNLTLTGTSGVTGLVAITSDMTTGRINVNGDHTFTTFNQTFDSTLQSSGSDVLSIGTFNSAATKTLTLNSAISIAGGTAPGNIILNGGTFALTGDLTLSGDITHSANSTLNIGGSNTLTYSGAAINIGALTLSISGAGTIANTLAFNLDQGSSILKIDGSGSITGPISIAGGTLDVNQSSSISGALSHSADFKLNIANGITLTYTGTALPLTASTLTMEESGVFAGNIDLAGGVLDIDGSADISGDLTISADSTVDIGAGLTLGYSGSDIDFGTFTLNLLGTGTLANTGALNLNSATSVLRVQDASSTISGPIQLAGGTLDIDNSMSVSGAITHTASSIIKVDPGKTLTYSGAPIMISSNVLTFDEAGTFAGSITLAGGTLDVDVTSDMTGTLSLSADSTLDIDGSATYNYNGPALDLGATTLLYSGAGTLSNTNSLNINNASSILQLTGSGATISGPILLSAGTIDVNQPATFLGNLTHSGSNKINIANSQTLTSSGGTLSIGAGNTLTFEEDGTFVGNIDLAGGTLDIDQTLTYSNSLTLSADSTIDIASTKNFSYGGGQIDLGTNTLVITGAGTLINTNPLNLNNATSVLKIEGTNTISGPVTLDAGLLDINESSTFSGAMTHTGDVSVDIASGKNLTKSGSSITLSGNRLTFREPGTLTGDIALNGGALDIDESMLISGNITHTASSALDILSGKTLTYNGAAINIGNFTMTLPGSGTFSNSGAITLDNANAILTITGALGTVSAVTQSTANSGTGVINVDADFSITTLTLNESSKIASSGSNLLTVTTLDGNNTGTLNLTSPLSITGGNGQVNINLNGTVFTTVATTTQSGDITVNADSTLNISSGTTYNYTGALVNLGANNLILSGEGSLANTNAFVMNDSSSNLILSGSNGTISGPVTLANGTLTLNDNFTISGTLTESFDSTVDIGTGKTLTYSGPSLDLGATTLTLSGEGTLANGNTLRLNHANSVLKITGTNATISGPLVLSGGTLDLDATTNISGDLTHTASSTLDLAASTTLTYSGNVVDLGAFTLTQLGAGNLTGTDAINLNNTSSVLKLDGAGATLNIPITLAGGTIDANEDLTISKAVTHSADATIDIEAGNTLTYSSTPISLSANTLQFGEAGTFTGSIVLAGGILDIDETMSLTGTLTHTADSSLDIATGKTLTYSGATLSLASAVLQLGEAGTFAGDMDLAGGTLDVDETMTFSGNLTQSASSTLDVANTKTFNYVGNAISIGNMTLTFGGSGTVNNTNAFITSNTGTTLLFDTAGSTISGPITMGGGNIDSDESVTINGDITLSTTTRFRIADTKILTYGGAAIPLSTASLIFEETGTFAGNIALNGGTLDIDASMDITGDITQTDASTLDIAGGSIFTYSGLAIDLNAFTLTLPGTGTLTNTNALNLNDGSSILRITAANTITGPIVLALGTLDIDATADISGDITHAASSTIDIASGTTLNYSGSTVQLGAFTLTLNGMGTLSNTNAIDLNTGTSILKMDGDGSEISGPVTLAGGVIDANQSVTLSGAIVQSVNSTIRIATGKILTYSNGSPISLANTLLFDEAGEFAGSIALNGGVLDIDESMTLSGTLTLSTSSSLDILAGKVFSYSGALLDFGVTTLTFSGGGTLTNSNALNLNNASSELQVDGSGAVITGPVILAGGLLDLNQSSTISGDLTHTADSTIDVAPGTTFTYSGTTLSLASNTLSFRETGTFAGKIDMAGGVLDLDNSLTFTDDLTHSANSTISILTGQTFTYSGAAISLNSNTLLFDETGTFAGSLALNGGTLDLDVSMSLTGNITNTADSTIDVAAGTTWAYSGTAIGLGANTLYLVNTGDINNTNAFSLDDSLSVLQISGAGRTISGPISLGGGILDVDDSITINGAITHSADTNFNIKSGDTVTYGGAVISISANRLTFGETGTFTGAIELAGGTLDIDANTTFSGNITHIASSSLDITGGVTLGYSGSAIDIAAFTLTMPGQGTLNNTFALNLNDASSEVQMDGNGSSISGPVAMSGGVLDVNQSSSINGTLTLSGSPTIRIASGETLTYGGGAAVDIAGGIILRFDEAGTFAGEIALNGGTLDIDASMTVSGVMTHTASSTLDIAAPQTLSYTDGTAIGLGAFTLLLSNSGTLANSGTLQLNNASSVLQITGSGTTISGPVDLGGGTLDVDQTSSISGAMTLSGDTSVDIANTMTLNYDATSDIDFGANTMTLSGDGTLNNTGSLNLNNGLSVARLNVSGASISGPVILAGGVLDIDQNANISGAISHTATSKINIAAGMILTYTGTAIVLSSNILSFDETGTFANGTVNLNGGTLDTNANMNFNGVLTHTNSSFLDITGTLTYTGVAINIGAYTLTMSGAGTFANTNALQLNSTSSELKIDVAGSTITGPVTLSGGGLIDINNNFTLSGDLSFSADASIDILGGTTFTYSSATAIDFVANTLDLSGTGTFANTGALNLNNSSSVLRTSAAVTDISGPVILAGGTLDLNQNTTISGLVTYSSSSKINIASGSTLSYSNGTAIDINTGSLTFEEDGGVFATGTINLGGGILDIDGNTQITGVITQNADSSIDIAGGKTLDYDGTSLALGTNSLGLTGVGIFDNANAVDMNNGASTLNLTGVAGTLNSLSRTVVRSTGSINVNSDYSITTLTLGQNSQVKSSGSFTLAVTSLNGAGTMDLQTGLSIAGGDGNQNISLNGGTLRTTAPQTHTGDISLAASSSLNIDSATTFTYSGTQVALGANTLTLSGAGTLAGTGLDLNSASSILRFSTSGSTISAPITLAGGTLDIDQSADISGAITFSSDSTIDIAPSQTLTYSGPTFNLGAAVLTLSNSGTLSNSNSINLNDGASRIVMNGTSGVITGPLNLNGGTLDINQNASFTGDITFTSASTIDVAAGKTLTYSGVAIALGGILTQIGTGTNKMSLSLDGGGALNITTAGIIAGALTLNGGTLDVDEDITITSTGNITVAATASTIDIAPGKTLTYQGNQIDVGAFVLTINGGGTFSNANPVTLNNAVSNLTLDNGVTINKVSVTIAGGTITNTASANTIIDLTLSADTTVTVSGGSLTVTGDLNITSTTELTITGSFTVSDIILNASLDIDGTITLADDATLIVLNSATFGPGSDLEFKDGVNVASSQTLTINDTDVTVTLTFSGGFTLAGFIDLQGDESLVLQSPTPDADVLAQITDNSAGTLTPAQPISNFAAAAANGQVDLTWGNNTTPVRICQSTLGYLASPCSSYVYDSSNDGNYSDTPLTNGVTYYYTAFSHDGTNTTYTASQTASATPVAGPSSVDDITGFTSTPDDSQIALSWTVPSPLGTYAGVRIMRKTSGYPTSSSDGTLVVDSTYDTTTDSYTDTGLENGTIYFYRAFGYDTGLSNFAVGVNTIAAAALIPSGLRAYFPLQGNERDGSGQGNHGILSNSNGSVIDATDRFGSASSAYSFDGVDDSIEFDNPVSDDFSISFWIKTTQSGTDTTQWYDNKAIVQSFDGSLQNDFGLTLGTAGEVMFGVSKADNINDVTLVGTDINDGSWYNVTATRNKNLATITLYVQGDEVGTSTATDSQPLSSATLLRIGSQGGGSEFFSGSLDEVRVYNRVLTPAEIQRLYFSAISKVEANISTGENHSCVLLGSGSVQCWGDRGGYGRLGDGTTSGITATPVTIPGISTAMQVSAGPNHSCTVLRNGSVQCWGEGANGKLGNSGSVDSNTPVVVSNISTALQVSAGTNHTCAVLESGTVECWGAANNGQLGNGVTGGTFDEPQSVSAILEAVQVGSGNDFSCALMADRSIRCWGEGSDGKLGNGATNSEDTPVIVSGISNAIQLSVGDTHACALLADNAIKCWGSGTNPSMGNGTSLAENATPVSVNTISTAIQVSAGKYDTCALLNDNTMMCWGLGDQGQLGDGGSGQQTTPVAANVNSNELNNVVHISSGSKYTCAVLNDGTSKCWGAGTSGQLGNGTSNSSTPLTVSGVTAAKQ